MDKVKNHTISLLWNIKLKATNEQTRQTNKQKCVDADHRAVGIRGRGTGEAEKGKGGQIYGDRGRFGFGCWTQNVVDRWCRTTHLCTFINRCGPNEFNKVKKISRRGNIPSTHTAAAHWTLAVYLAFAQKLGLFLNLKWENGSVAMIQTIGTYGSYSFCQFKKDKRWLLWLSHSWIFFFT